MDTDRLFNHVVDVTKQHAREAVLRHRGDEQPIRQKVFVLVMNGAVLGVLQTEARAQAEADQLRASYPGEWKGDGRAWFQRELQIDLSITEHTVVG